MPYLKIATNLPTPMEQNAALVKEASALAAEQLGKDEAYMLVEVAAGQDLTFGGTADPAAMVELRGLSLTEELAQKLTPVLCEFLRARLNIPPERVYLNFFDVPRPRWGWNGKTFAG